MSVGRRSKKQYKEVIYTTKNEINCKREEEKKDKQQKVGGNKVLKKKIAEGKKKDLTKKETRICKL